MLPIALFVAREVRARPAESRGAEPRRRRASDAEPAEKVAAQASRSRTVPSFRAVSPSRLSR